jgi:hypothetical protein
LSKYITTARLAVSVAGFTTVLRIDKVDEILIHERIDKIKAVSNEFTSPIFKCLRSWNGLDFDAVLFPFCHSRSPLATEPATDPAFALGGSSTSRFT